MTSVVEPPTIRDTDRAPDRQRFFRLVWLFPFVFACHVAEEAPNFSRWVVETMGGHTSLAEFLRNHVVYVVVLGTLTGLAARRKTNAAGFALMLWISAQQFWNFVFHLATTLRFDTYSPGLVTAILLYYPSYLLMAYLAVRGGVLSVTRLALTLAVGGVGLGLIRG